MPSTDHIASFLFSTLLHALGLLLLGSQAARLAKPDATAPELKVSSVELALATIEPAIPSDSASDGTAGQQQEEPLQPLDMPQATEQPPAPVLPDKPAFTDALTPPPEPSPTPAPSSPPPTVPAPVSAPAPQAALTPPPAAAPQPSAPAATPRPVSTKSAATASSGSSDRALIFPANGGGGASGRIDAHPALNRPIKPNYPIGARRRGEEGTVILDVVVAEDGMAQAVSKVASSGFPELDDAAERAAAKARFKPGTRDGKPVASCARITIIFRLRDA